MHLCFAFHLGQYHAFFQNVGPPHVNAYFNRSIKFFIMFRNLLRGVISVVMITGPMVIPGGGGMLKKAARERSLDVGVIVGLLMCGLLNVWFRSWICFVMIVGSVLE
jgi:hypothetical protein